MFPGDTYFCEDISEELDIEVGRYHDEKQPVTKAKLAPQILECSEGEARRDCPQVVGSQSGACKCADSNINIILHFHYSLEGFLPEDHVETGENEEYEEPEPESDEDLVIDHVDGEDTQSIKSNIDTALLLNHFKLKCSDTFEYFLKLRSFEKNIS